MQTRHPKTKQTKQSKRAYKKPAKNTKRPLYKQQPSSPVVRPALRRGADGRLKVADSKTGPKTAINPNTYSDIGDIWAEQRYISRQEMLIEERSRKARAKRQQELGLIGRAKAALVGDPASKLNLKHKASHSARHNTRPPDSSSKIIEINIAMPKLPLRLGLAQLNKLSNLLRPTTFRRNVSRSQQRRRKIITGCLAIVALSIITLIVTAFPRHQSSSQPATNAESNQAGLAPTRPADLSRGTPEYNTILPVGKDITALGGWTRVSPKDKDPVFAYVDKVGSIQLNVSQQPLPEALRTDNTAEQIAQLARGFNATEEVVANGITVHIGTSAKGPQSAIMVRDDLLILVKSAAPLTTAQWTDYISSLR